MNHYSDQPSSAYAGGRVPVAHVSGKPPKKKKTMLVLLIVLAIVLVTAVVLGILGASWYKANAEVKAAQASFLPPAQAYQLDMTKDDPSDGNVRFSYDSRSRIISCSYTVKDKLYEQEYTYDDSAKSMTISTSYKDTVIAEIVISYDLVDQPDVFVDVDGYVVRLDEESFSDAPEDGGDNTDGFFTSRDFVMNKFLVECGDTVYYVDKNGLWKKTAGSESERLVECSATNLATNGKVIYYSAFNQNVKYKVSSREIDVRQYDLYSYDLSTGENKKLTSFIECGKPICAVGDTVYYTDYSEDFDGNAAGLSQGLYAYQITTGEKKYITDGAHMVTSCKGKIFYRTIMAAGGGFGVHQIHCYDTADGSSKVISGDSVMGFKVISDKLYYWTKGFDQASSNDLKCYCYDIATGDTKTLLEKNGANLQDGAYDDKYIIYSVSLSGSTEIYRVDVNTGEEVKIDSSAVRSNASLRTMRLEDQTVFFADNCMYTLDDNSTQIVQKTGNYQLDTLLAINGGAVFGMEEYENFYEYEITYLKLI